MKGGRVESEKKNSKGYLNLSGGPKDIFAKRDLKFGGSGTLKDMMSVITLVLITADVLDICFT